MLLTKHWFIISFPTVLRSESICSFRWTEICESHIRSIMQWQAYGVKSILTNTLMISYSGQIERIFNHYLYGSPNHLQFVRCWLSNNQSHQQFLSIDKFTIRLSSKAVRSDWEYSKKLYDAFGNAQTLIVRNWKKRMVDNQKTRKFVFRSVKIIEIINRVPSIGLCSKNLNILNLGKDCNMATSVIIVTFQRFRFSFALSRAFWWIVFRIQT